WILCEEQDRAQEAVALADRGLEINRDYVDLVDTRGVAYYRLGRYDKAVEDLARCVEMYPAGNPAGAGSRFHLARAYAKLKRSADAIRLLKEALDLHKRIGGLTAADVAEAEKLLADLQP
ncbi:MAG: tetratricopeptide repeat protein, partial [Phycisphaerae bacterium]|nr:tetratricopeptide repeat protein [Phycisphaerae bacterium]